MLRFLYLLSLLLCIELSFCHNYIDEGIEHSFNNLRRNVRREKARRVRRPYTRKRRVLQEEDYDRSPVQFDVASFIQPEEDSLEADEMVMKHKHNKRRNTRKPYDFSLMLKKDDSNKMEKTPDYMNLADINQPLPKDFNLKHFGFNPLDDLNGGKYGHDKFRNIYKDDLLMNQNVHGHEKKCSLKSLKFPFFSHNKSQPLKPKRDKKRFFFFNNLNKKEFVEIPDFNKISEYPYKINFKKKRSYDQRLCPACKKIFIANMSQDRIKKNHKKQIIHNSRQFYQNRITDSTLKDDVKVHAVRRARGSDGSMNMAKRDDKARQMKELEEVQRKIDSVEINQPHFEAPVPVPMENPVLNK